MDKKQQIIAAMYAFIGQRAGLEFGNYGDVKSYRAEQRAITKDRHHARRLIRDVELRDSISADDILTAAKGAYSGRLTIVERDSFECMTCAHKWTGAAHVADVSDVCPKCDSPHTYHRPAAIGIDYCTGQYFPTEYRRAVCAVMASVLWNWKRTQCMPDSFRGATVPPTSPGDYLRAGFKREYGRGLAARWFS